jgi:hypothetical protein
MKQTYITRFDEVGAGFFDSIAWAFEKYGKGDNVFFNYGMIVGNEDSPERIELWKTEPNWNTPADLILK